MEISYTIPLKPVTKKNSQRIVVAHGHPHIVQSAAYLRYEELCGYVLHPRPVEPFNRPVQVKCLFYMPTRGIVDLTNLLNAIDDILVKYKILEDDNYKILASHDGSRVLYDKENPRTEIYIEYMPDAFDPATVGKGKRKPRKAAHESEITAAPAERQS